MKSLFEEAAKAEIQDRIEQLSDTRNPTWGKMNASQMLHHCQFPLKVALKKEHPSMKPNFLAKLFFKKSMYNDKPWKKNLPTLSKFKVPDQKNFNTEKEALLTLIQEFSEKKNVTSWDPHPMFGTFTGEQWGKMQYKHLDHHLRQFNV